MSEIYIKYPSLENAIEYSANSRDGIDDYIEEIKAVINKRISKLPGEDTYGYAEAAINLANQKIEQLTTKKKYFSDFEKATQNIICAAESADSNVSKNMSSIAESHIEDRKWYEAAGDWIYNTFCVDLVNTNFVTRGISDGIKWVNDKVGNAVEGIHNWFKYGDGQYIWKIGTSVVGAVVAVAGAIAAICAIPFTGGFSIPLVIGCVGAAATSIGAIITVVNSVWTIRTSSKAFTLRDDSPGAARYYNSASKMSEAFEKFDFGDESTNKRYERRGVRTDRVKVVADTTALVCNIANLGNVRDYRVTTRTDNINFKYNSDEWYKGYSFTWKNIKKNLQHEMGMKVTTGEFKEGALGLKLKSTDKVSKYILNLSDKTFACPDEVVKFFNGAKTTKNGMDLVENVDGLYDFYTEPDKSFSGFLDATGNAIDIGKTSKPGKVINKYIRKPYKNLKDAFDTPEELNDEVR